MNSNLDSEEQKFSDDIDKVLNRMKLRRNTFEESGIYGTLSNLDSFDCATLEHSYDDSHGNFEPKIPNGTYICKRSMHELDGMVDKFETFQVMDVPGHNNILIHWGNYNKDSEGCILVGETRSGNMIINSRETFAKFMELMGGSILLN